MVNLAKREKVHISKAEALYAATMGALLGVDLVTRGIISPETRIRTVGLIGAVLGGIFTHVRVQSEKTERACTIMTDKYFQMHPNDMEQFDQALRDLDLDLLAEEAGIDG